MTFTNIRAYFDDEIRTPDLSEYTQIRDEGLDHFILGLTPLEISIPRYKFRVWEERCPSSFDPTKEGSTHHSTGPGTGLYGGERIGKFY